MLTSGNRRSRSSPTLKKSVAVLAGVHAPNWSHWYRQTGSRLVVPAAVQGRGGRGKHMMFVACWSKGRPGAAVRIGWRWLRECAPAVQVP